jgi:hypothetical protein
MNKNVIQFLKSISTFFLFSFIIYIVLVCVWGELVPKVLHKNLKYKIGSYGHMFTRINEVKRTENVDILFLGSSHSYRGFDTRIFKEAGFITFNLGSGSQTPIQTEILLERYLDRLNPKMIIYEVYPITFVLDGVESSVDLIANDNNDSLTLNLALKQNNIKVYNTLIYAYYRELFDRNSGFKEALERDGDIYVSGGYVESEIKYFRHLNYEKQKWNLKDLQLKSFENILSKIKMRKINLLLVQAPITKSLYDSYSNNDFFDKRMREYGNYYNFNNFMQLDDSLFFYNKDHLNQSGVEKFNKELINILLRENEKRY